MLLVEASCYGPQCVTSGSPNHPFVQAFHTNKSSSLNGFGLGSDPHLEGEIQKEKEQTEVIESAFLIC